MQNTPNGCIRMQRKTGKSGMVHENTSRTYHSSVLPFEIGLCIYVCVCVCVCVCLCVKMVHGVVIRLFGHSK